MPVRLEFLERALHDDAAAQRLARILEASGGPGSEEEIYERMRQELVRRAEGILYASFPRLAGEYTADELVKEFAGRLWRIMGERRTITTPEEFFRRACYEFRYILLDHLRRSRRREELHVEYGPDLVANPSPEPSEEVEVQDQLELLRGAIHNLDPDDQEIMTLRAGGMTLEAIGRGLGLPTSTVHHRLNRIIERLRAVVAG